MRIVAAGLLASLSCAVCAADRTWDGGGGNAYWTTPANWDGDATAPGAGHIDNAHFSGSGTLRILHDRSGTVISVR